MIREENVEHIVGCYTSASRKQVIPIVERTERLLWHPARYEGFESSDNVIYVGAAPNHTVVPLVRHMLEHIENDGAAIAEFARTLTPGGEAVVMVPTRPDWRTAGTREFGAPDPREGHWRLYGCDFTQRLRASGLEDRTIPTAELRCAEACELMDDAIFIARKPLARAS